MKIKVVWMTSSFVRFEEIPKQIFAKNFSCLSHKERRKLPRSPKVGSRWSYPFTVTFEQQKSFWNHFDLLKNEINNKLKITLLVMFDLYSTYNICNNLSGKTHIIQCQASILVHFAESYELLLGLVGFSFHPFYVSCCVCFK